MRIWEYFTYRSNRKYCILVIIKVRFCFIEKCQINRLFPYEVTHSPQIHIRIQWLQTENEETQNHYLFHHIACRHHVDDCWLTTSLQNNSILSSGGICDPSELLSFWLELELLQFIALTPDADSEPSILSNTCSHTLRHCRNSLATKRSYLSRTKIEFKFAHKAQTWMIETIAKPFN